MPAGIVVRGAGTVVSLARRPVLFALAQALAEAWPARRVAGDLARPRLSGEACRRIAPRPAAGRDRAASRKASDRWPRSRATPRGFRLAPRETREVVVLARPVEEEHAAVLALLADGESWSSSALALALGAGQRTVQRALEALAAAGKVQSFGRGRARRWMTPPYRDSRQPCYSRLRCRATRVIAEQEIRK